MCALYVLSEARRIATSLTATMFYLSAFLLLGLEGYAKLSRIEDKFFYQNLAKRFARCTIAALQRLCGAKFKLDNLATLRTANSECDGSVTNQLQYELLVLEHASTLDIYTLLVAAGERPIIFVIAENLGKVPLFGKLAKAAGMVFLEKETSTKGRTHETVPAEALRKNIKWFNAHNTIPLVVVFPTGRRTKPDENFEVARGTALLAQRTLGSKTIVAMKLRGPGEVWPASNNRLLSEVPLTTLGPGRVTLDTLEVLALSEVTGTVRAKTAEINQWITDNI